MKLYYCDVCENEITGLVHIAGLDFGRGTLELCNTCYSKFKPALNSLYAEYKDKYDELDSDYLDDLKELILAEPETPVVTPTIEEEEVTPRR